MTPLLFVLLVASALRACIVLKSWPLWALDHPPPRGAGLYHNQERSPVASGEAGAHETRRYCRDQGALAMALYLTSHWTGDVYFVRTVEEARELLARRRTHRNAA